MNQPLHGDGSQPSMNDDVQPAKGIMINVPEDILDEFISISGRWRQFPISSRAPANLPMR